MEPEPVAAQTLELDASNVDGFDLAGWKAEEDQPAPEGDPTLSAAAVEVQSAITEHQPIDTSAAWDDIEAFLPDLATPLPRADDMEARERLRLVLLRAIREGSVPQWAVDNLALGDDGEPDPEASALLGMVINDLGAETDERFEYSTPHESFEVFVAPEEKPGEEDAVAEALAFVDNLADRRNDPLRIYQRAFQRQSLLTAEAEAALGQAMERGLDKALDALASWPSGVGSVLDAAKRVAAGTKSLRWLSSGPQVEPEETEPAPSAELKTDPSAELELPAEGEVVGAQGESDSQFGLDAKESSDELAKFCANAEFLSGLAVGTSTDTPEWEACAARKGVVEGFEFGHRLLGSLLGCCRPLPWGHRSSPVLGCRMMPRSGPTAPAAQFRSSTPSRPGMKKPARGGLIRVLLHSRFRRPYSQGSQTDSELGH